MEYILLTLAVVCAVVGLVGGILPALPGPPVSYVALWLLWLYDRSSVSSTTLVVAGLLMVLITVLDYVAPIWLTKKGQGSKAGIRGSMIGLIVGCFFPPLGLILGPFVGALVGELLVKTPPVTALKVAFMSFVAFLLTTALKLIYSVGVIGMLIAYWF